MRLFFVRTFSLYVLVRKRVLLFKIALPLSGLQPWLWSKHVGRLFCMHNMHIILLDERDAKNFHALWLMHLLLANLMTAIYPRHICWHMAWGASIHLLLFSTLYKHSCCKNSAFRQIPCQSSLLYLMLTRSRIPPTFLTKKYAYKRLQSNGTYTSTTFLFQRKRLRCIFRCKKKQMELTKVENPSWKVISFDQNSFATAQSFHCEQNLTLLGLFLEMKQMHI